MGQAKQRGTFEDRKKAAIERDEKRRRMEVEINRRRASPKHIALFGIVAEMMTSVRKNGGAA